MGVNIALEISKTRRGKKKEKKKSKDNMWFCEINEWLTFLWKIKNLPATNWCLVQFYYHIESHYFCYIWCHLSIFNPKKCHKISTCISLEPLVSVFQIHISHDLACPGACHVSLRQSEYYLFSYSLTFMRYSYVMKLRPHCEILITKSKIALIYQTLFEYEKHVIDFLGEKNIWWF